MADDISRLKQYDYAANSNLVLSNQRGRRRPDPAEGTGEVSRITVGQLPGRMGDRAAADPHSDRDLDARLSKLRKRAADDDNGLPDERDRDRDHRTDLAPRKRARVPDGGGSSAADVVEAADAIARRAGAGAAASAGVGVGYRPKTKTSQLAYERILGFVRDKLGDQPRDLLWAGAEECLAVLKNDRMKDSERRAEISETLGQPVNEDEYGTLAAFGRNVTDFDHGDDAVANPLDDVDGDDGALDEEMGVAVVFDEEEDDDEDESEPDEVVDQDDDLDEDGPMNDVVAADALGGGGTDQPPESNDLDPHSIDAYWLQRQLRSLYSDATTSQNLAAEILQILSDPADDPRLIENRLMNALDFENFDLVKLLLRNRFIVLYCTRLAVAQTPEAKRTIEDEMNDTETGKAILARLRDVETVPTDAQASSVAPPDQSRKAPRGRDSAHKPTARRSALVDLTELDLSQLTFQQGSHLMSNRRCELPKGSLRIQKNDYEEVHVPATVVKPALHEHLISVPELPEWAHGAFRNTQQLNRIQSKVYPCAFQRDENFLLCAPTGAGKTNVALLAILRVVENHRADGHIDLNAFKVVYIAPMKALVAEVVENLGQRLEYLGMRVHELTGDVSMSKQEIAETQVIVTTPEKWDIITRKAGERAFTQLVRLMIVDEIHLLHDDRGPVLESVIARTVRGVETSVNQCRVVGLSATLPNYRDVAAFLKLKQETGLFHFDASFRPCPLQQQYIGISTKKALRRFQLMNEVTYEKVKEQVTGPNNPQVIVFVHSRKETAATASFVRDSALRDRSLDVYMRPDSAEQEMVRTELESVSNADLKDLLLHGFGIHHAGMTRSDRSLVEALFADRRIKVLFSTATLAWGVNLPAHAVIIKGTQVYLPEKGDWGELSPMDVMQMMGRAGRPQYDNHGEGIVITTHGELQFYLSLLNQQLPIESQMVSRLADSLNAEIALGTVSNMKEACSWLGYTYLYTRMQRNPTLYGIPSETVDEDPSLQKHRRNLIHSAVLLLDKVGLVRYDRKSLVFQSTDLGVVASHYYITHKSMSVFADNLKATMTDIDLLRLFSLSGEFTNMRVREEEKLELTRLGDRVPIPVKDSMGEVTAKVNVLLQSFVSHLSLDGLALSSDMIYVTQSAGRIMRALFEIVLRRKWASLTLLCLDLSKMISRRMWLSQSPLRQFSKQIPEDAVKKLERKDIDFERYYDLTQAEIGELLRNPKLGRTVHRLVHFLPRLEVAAHVQPITRSTLRVELTLMPDFKFDPKLHGAGESFWVFVEDADSETVLHSEVFYLRGRFAEEEHVVTFTVPLSEPLAPHYFVRVASDRWIAPDTVIPISFRHLVLPTKFAPYTQLLDMQPLQVSKGFADFEDFKADADGLEMIRSYFLSKFKYFNPVQTQAFSSLFGSDANCLIGAPAGSGHTVCAEIALARLFLLRPTSSAVFLVGETDQVATRKAKEFAVGLGDTFGLIVGTLSGEIQNDLRLLATPGVLVVATAEKWDMLSRRWKQRRAVRDIGLFVIDDMHLVGGNQGPVMEACGSRMRYIAAQAVAAGKPACRIVGLCDSVPNARDLADWIGVESSNVFAFDSSARTIPLETHIQPVSIGGDSSVLAFARPIFSALEKHAADGEPAVVLVASRKLSRATAFEIVASAEASGDRYRFRHAEDGELESILTRVHTSALRECLANGVAYVHEGLSASDQTTAVEMFESGKAQVLVTTIGYAKTCGAARGRVVIFAGTSEVESNHALRQSEYPLSSVMHAMGRAGRAGKDRTAVCVVLTSPSQKEYYRKFLVESAPVESHLDHVLADQLNSEIVAKVVRTKQDAVDYITWTLFYRRLPQNPNYYNMTGNTPRHISDHLSELIETAISDLEACKCVAAEGEDDMVLGPLNLGMIASYYYIKYTTVELFASSIQARTKLRGLLEVLAAATEYEDVAIRANDDEALQRLARHLPISLARSGDGGSVRYADPHVKTHLLLQSHFSRSALAGDLAEDRRHVVGKAARLLQAMVDVISSSGWLKPALAAMELSQMVTQAMWDRDSALLQLPHVTPEKAAELEAQDVKGIFDVIEMEDGGRQTALGLGRREMADVARVCNGYPDIEMTVEAEEDQESGAAAVVVRLERETDDAEGEVTEVPQVSAPRYPGKKEEGWWVVVGDPAENQLLAVKRVAVKSKANVRLELDAAGGEGARYMVYFMCDGYVGCDQDEEVGVGVGQKG